MLDTIMPTSNCKRRVVFVDDKTWQLVEQVSSSENISHSKALRKILEVKK